MSAVTPEQLAAAAAALATHKLRQAKAHIQRAQDELSSACAALSALNGAVPVWTACHKLTDKVHAFWYRVDSLHGNKRYSLDRLHVDNLRKQLEKAAAAADPGAPDHDCE